LRLSTIRSSFKGLGELFEPDLSEPVTQLVRREVANDTHRSIIKARLGEHAGLSVWEDHARDDAGGAPAVHAGTDDPLELLHGRVVRSGRHRARFDRAGCSPRHDGGEEQRQEPECTQTGQVISRRVTRFVPAAASASV
jgi:hypothetical protein